MLAASTSAVIARNVTVRRCGASESRYRKSYSPEKITGAVIASARTLLIGNAVIGSLNKKKRRANNSYYRENAKGHKKSGAVSVSNKVAVDSSTHCIGQIAAAVATATAASALLYFSTKNNGLDCVNDGGRCIVAYRVGITH